MTNGTRAEHGALAAPPTARSFELEFYKDPKSKADPVRKWMKSLDAYQREAIGVALRVVLQEHGIGVCRGEWGKPLGKGLFEFRVRHNAAEILGMFTDETPRDEHRTVLLRVFCHAHGDRLVLLLAGYDKEGDPSDRRENREIELARARLAEYRRRTGA